LLHPQLFLDQAQPVGLLPVQRTARSAESFEDRWLMAAPLTQLSAYRRHEFACKEGA